MENIAPRIESEQPALITEREVLEGLDPETLKQVIQDAYIKMNEIERFAQLATEVYEGVTGQEYEGAM